ncbi:MAG: hypothetical protein IJK22_01760 [Bacteroidales bacterium]|nr:hypothetical protein [Bacteroidales bacterium]
MKEFPKFVKYRFREFGLFLQSKKNRQMREPSTIELWTAFSAPRSATGLSQKKKYRETVLAA